MKFKVAHSGHIYLGIIVTLFILFMIASIFCPDFNSKSNTMDRTFVLYKIGEISRKNGRTFIIINKEYIPGLEGLEDFPEVTVVYWFHQNDNPDKRSILKVHPKGNPENPIRGVFATHAPVRPNLLGISRVKIISVNENVLEIDEIDAYDHSPVIDLKN
jgi:tRNA-Thr(GGU) m(6)t(6)A37 methyltransferase TsaA